MLTFDEWVKKTGVFSQGVIANIDAYATEKMIPFSDALIASGTLSEEEYLKLLAKFNNTDFLTAAEVLEQLDEQLLDLIPPDKARELCFMPFKMEDSVLKILVNDGSSRQAEAYAASAIMCNYVVPVYLLKEELDAFLDRFYLKADLSDAIGLGELDNYAIQANYSTIDLEESDSVISRILNEMIKAAIENTVSDIHIAPEETGVSIRFRKDGILAEYASFDNQVLLKRLINKIKTSAGLKIEESRKTQSGHYSATYKGNTVNFRVSTLPTIHGIEKVTLRLLDQQALNLSIENMRFRPDIKESFLRIIKKPQGIFLLTGPTGSGKTTTLYTALAAIASPEISIVTLEDPPEFQLGKHIVQSQVNRGIDMDFAALLREVLRQDPDVILVGEIRDIETAQIAVQAANTGHLVFSTLHTNDSVAAVTRLIEMGVHTYNIADSLLAVMGQRLVRRVCPNCRVPHDCILTKEDKLMLHTEDDKFSGYVANKKGCSVCRYTGYAGRIPVHELFMVDDEVRRMLAEGKTSVDIRQYTSSMQMKTLAEDAYIKAKDGHTTIDEIRRVIG